MGYKKTDFETNFVKIEMESGDGIVLELDPTTAPITVANFKKLVARGFYDGLIFHRVIAGFMIQGGDPTGTGMGGSEETIKGEFIKNGVNNPLSHKRGVISMARSMMNNSASSQFFICHADATFLDGSYAAFGKTVEGIETVDKIAAGRTDRNDRPLQTQKMKKVYFVEAE
ncbi:MAG: peptidylprolyl isomerase [Clostridia bacterium]|nr:peptidylprolyl isomerase [Clostridia bacterium]